MQQTQAQIQGTRKRESASWLHEEEIENVTWYPSRSLQHLNHAYQLYVLQQQQFQQEPLDALTYPQQQQVILHYKDAYPYNNNSNQQCTTSANSAGSCGPAAPAKRKKFARGLSRFRDRLHQQEERLKLDVNSLRQDIMDLQLHKSIMETRTVTTRFCATGSAAKLVREYFVTFHHGFQAFPPSYSPHEFAQCAPVAHPSLAGNKNKKVAVPLLQSQVDSARTQNAFLEAMVHPQMEFRTHIGRDVLRDQWQRYTQCHAGLRMQMLTLETSSSFDATTGDTNSVVFTTGRLTAYITRQTLELIFPMVLRNHRLAQRLIGSFIEYPFRIEFHVNTEGKITKYDADVDFVAALSKVLGSFDDVTTIMRHALITEYCMIGHLDDEEEVDHDDEEVDHDDEEVDHDDEDVGDAEQPEVVEYLEESRGCDDGSNRKAALDYILS